VSEKSNQILFCWEQVLKTNRAFRISRIFAPGETAPGLLPLYALFSSVEQICSDIQDEELAIRKLHWWRRECLNSDMGSSDHPLLSELHRTGVTSSLQMKNIAQLLDAAESRLDSPAPADLEELKCLCVEVSRPQLEMEISLSGIDGGGQLLDSDFGAHSGLLQLIRESAGAEKQGAYWWIPLNLLARHGLSRASLAESDCSKAAQDIFSEIIEAGSSWGRVNGDTSPDISEALSALRHLFVIHSMYQRKLLRLERLTPAAYAAELGRLRLSDLFGAWKVARRISLW